MQTKKGKSKDAAPEPEVKEKRPTIAPPPGGVGDANRPPRGEEIDGGDVDEVIRLDAGESVTVLYRGAKKTQNKKDGKESLLHKIVLEDGVARGLWGTVQLDAMLAKCRAGDTLWVAYLGKDDIPGGKTMHNWKVVRVKAASV